MFTKIQRLPEQVINQIAAGEVVENPASIVKELIENSLDAGARWISIQTEKGGLERIQIEDDGCGMSKEDALLSIERHATSKIRDVKDLNTLSTMGFRGEALAAIFSVCLFDMKTFDGKEGTRIFSKVDGTFSIEPCARNLGTSIEVRSLFFNTPARKKFQKSIGANAALISKVIETIALAHPEITFIHNGKKLLSKGIEERIEEIVGSHEHEVKSKYVKGWVASPQRASSRKVGQYLFLNKRPIVSPLIAKAVKAAFGTRISEHEYPRFVLFLEIAPDQIDVNVHPQKKEARFKESQTIFLMVKHAVEKTFTTDSVLVDEPKFTPTSIEFSQSFPSMCYKKEEKLDLDFIYHDRILAISGNYLFLEKEQIIVVDLKALYARVLYDSLVVEKAKVEPLLTPLEIPLEKGDEKRIEEMQKMGVECRLFQKLLIIDALPSFLKPSEFPQFFQSFKEEKKMEDALIKFSSHRKKQYTMDEAAALWSRLQKCSDHYFDPKGNPIFIALSEKIISHLFTRGQHG